MNFYVAGRTTDLYTVRSIAEGLEEEGHKITFKWYDPDVGEIRHDGIHSEDLEMIIDVPPHLRDKREPGLWSSTIKHKPTGKIMTGEGISKIAAHEVAINLLRADLNAGWSSNPERAREIAQAEMTGIADADALVLVWAPDLLGSAIETGAALWNSDMMVFVYRPGRDSVFWYLPNCRIVWSRFELLEAVEEKPEWMP